MAKFFGLFGNKSKYVDEPTEEAAQEKSEAFFLSADDAKTLGNTEFMRKSYRIAHRFPKTANSQGSETVEEISAFDKARVAGTVAGSPTPAAAAKPETQSGTPAPPEASRRRNTDSSLDRFRQMARDLKK